MKYTPFGLHCDLTMCYINYVPETKNKQTNKHMGCSNADISSVENDYIFIADMSNGLLWLTCSLLEITHFYLNGSHI